MFTLVAGGGGALAKGPPLTTDVPADVHRYQLQPASDGTYLYSAAGFTATIAVDGTVTFHSASLTPRSRLAEILTNTGEGRRAEPWPIPEPTYDRPTPYDNRDRQLDPFTPTIPLAEPIFVDTGARFDLAEVYGRALGQDPYRDAKAAFLADTFDFRMGLAARQRRQAMADLPTRLREIWTDPSFSPAERRQIIYLLWRETSDEPQGQAARQIIRSFAEQNFPPAEAARFSGGRPTEPRR